MPIRVDFLKTDDLETAQLEIAPISDLADLKNLIFKLFTTCIYGNSFLICQMKFLLW